MVYNLSVPVILYSAEKGEYMAGLRLKSKERIKKLTLTAVFTALVAVGAFINIPIMTVPYTMQFLFCNLAGILLGAQYGTLSIVLYLVMGLAGVPIFTKGGGIGYVFQPTFGYLIGFAVGCLVAALVCSKGRYSYTRIIVAGLVNVAIVYAVGMLYFDLLMRFYFGTPKDGMWILINLCLIFLPVDIIWCVVSAVVAKRLLPVLYKNDPRKMLRISTVYELKCKVLAGGEITEKEARRLKYVSLSALCNAADEIRKRFMQDRFDICSIVNAKNGGCGEDCKFCGQAARYGCREKGELIDAESYAKAYDAAEREGLNAISAVTAGRALPKAEIEKMCAIYEAHIDGKTERCASHGLVDKESLIKLKESGVTRIHNNLETCEQYFSKVCTTHTHAEKLDTVRTAKELGFKVCSGGIIGVGESMNDRIKLALELRREGVYSVPLNVLIPKKGTPLEEIKPLPYDEIRRTFAIFRFILPDTFIRPAAGRRDLPDKGEKLFRCGANAAITGDYLTTKGVGVDEDKAMIKRLGFVVDAERQEQI